MDSKPELDLPVRTVITHQERAQVGDTGQKSAITEAEASLRSYMEESLRTRFNTSPCKPTAWFYYGFYDFVLREGRFFTPRPQLGDIRCGAAGEPFLNSLRNASAKQLTYVEGYAVTESSSTPVLHAWNSGGDGFVVDTTWHPVGVAYLGVVIPNTLVYASTDEEGRIGSSIDNWRRHWPLLQRPWSTTLAESAMGNDGHPGPSRMGSSAQIR
jgi:hypothetical protein